MDALFKSYFGISYLVVLSARMPAKRADAVNPLGGGEAKATTPGFLL